MAASYFHLKTPFLGWTVGLRCALIPRRFQKMNNLVTKTKSEILIGRIRDLIELVDQQVKVRYRKVIERSFPDTMDFSAEDIMTLRTIRALRGKVPLKRVVERLAEMTDEPVHASAVSSIMTRFKDAGLLLREDNPLDQRQPLNTLSPTGEDLARRFDEVHTSILKDIVEALALDEALAIDLSQRVERAYERVTQPKPSIAGIYDYVLGGISNTPIDRMWVEKEAKVDIQFRDAAKANRAFLQRAVYHLAKERGITQFLDIGSGFPTNRNTHEVALEINPMSNVTYVDNDPEVVRASRNLLHETENVRIAQKDLKFIERWLTSDRFENIDFTKPVAILMVAVLHFVTDDAQVRKILDFLKEKLAKGSYLVISISIMDPTHKESLQKLSDSYRRQVSDVVLRTPEAVDALLREFDLIEPKLINILKWRPDLPDNIGTKNANSEYAPLLACIAKI